MAQDIRDLLENQPKNERVNMSQGHEAKFLQKLNKALPQERKVKSFNFLNIAASVVILLGLSYGAFKFFETQPPIESTQVATTNLKTMGDISPDFKKVEDYYLASINLELSKVKLTPENKDLFDGYIERLKELNAEYNNLTIEFNKNGPSEIIFNALSDNLKFRLNLVMRLKEKLQEFDDSAFTEQNI